jgi:tetratricopeptide (TPR) repeat protein
VKRFIKTWLRTAPPTLVAVMFFVILSSVADTFFGAGREFTRICIVIELVIFGYSIFAAIWERDEHISAYDKRIIRDSFSGGGRRAKRFRQCIRFISEGNMADALDELNRLKEQTPSGRENAVLCFYLGRCYQFMGYPTNAKKLFLEAIETGIDVDEVFTLCGREMVTCGDFAGAEAVYNKLLERKGTSEYVLTDLGMLYIKSNEPEKALQAFSNSIKNHMNYAFAMGGCALAYLLKKDTENASFFYSQAIINNIDDSDGFTEYYISVAETQGLADNIGIKPKQKVYLDPTQLEAKQQ